MGTYGQINIKESGSYFEKLSTNMNECVDDFLNNFHRVNLDIIKKISAYRYLLSITGTNDSSVKLSSRNEILELLIQNQVINLKQLQFLQDYSSFRLFLRVLYTRLEAEKIIENSKKGTN